MVRSLAPLAFALVLGALLASGCVYVTNPVGDIDKAEPDKRLLGDWATADGSEVWSIDRPDVKGNPKGLMRATSSNPNRKDGVYFFVATVGDKKYINLLAISDKKGKDIDFGREGGYEKWTKLKDREYLVVQYQAGKDEIVLNFGDDKAFHALAEGEKLPRVGTSDVFVTPPGWLTKYLEKNGGDAIYTAKSATKMPRKK